MYRLLGLIAVLALVCGTSVIAADKKDDKPSIKDIMTKAHNGGESLLGRLRAELKESDPDWADVNKNSKELVKLGGDLAGAKPDRGDLKSWKKQTTAYVANAKALASAAAKKDRKAAEGSLKRITSSCTACHAAHKPKAD
jgi:cytochrome c556